MQRSTTYIPTDLLIKDGAYSAPYKSFLNFLSESK
jgi:hypothetical protein